MKMPKSSSNPEISKSQPRQVILDTAKRLFAEKGFAGTSIRDITSEAGCNLAAVNYHFHGKDKLYLEVLTQTLITFREELISSIAAKAERRNQHTTLESLLRAFAKTFLEPFVVGQQQLLKLIIHEMTEPRLPAGMFFREVIQPVEISLIKALKHLCPEISEGGARRCISSVVAQLIHVVHSQRLFAERPEWQQKEFDLSEIVEHIVRFSGAGIQACTK
jgi:AcrR family transcriptional regulator